MNHHLSVLPDGIANSPEVKISPDDIFDMSFSYFRTHTVRRHLSFFSKEPGQMPRNSRKGKPSNDLSFWLPRWDAMISFAPWSRAYFNVGKTDLIRESSLIFRFWSRGTLKSTLTSVDLSEISISFIDFMFDSLASSTTECFSNYQFLQYFCSALIFRWMFFLVDHRSKNFIIPASYARSTADSRTLSPSGRFIADRKHSVL